MTIENFVPELWSAAVEAPYEKALVYTQPKIANRKFEGTLRAQGDTVHVTTISAPTVKQYVKGSDIEIEELADGRGTITVDQGDYFAFGVNDVDEVQAAGDFESPATRMAGEAMKDKVDTFAAGLLKNGAGHKLGTVTVVDGDPTQVQAGQKSAYQILVKLREKLDKASVPAGNRYVVVPPEYISALLMDKRYTDLSASGSSDALLNGQVGKATGFDVLVSNNVPTTGSGATLKHHVVAGVADGLSFISQINQTEALRDPKQFRDIIRGLMIYGGKVMRPEAVAVADVTIVEPTAPEAPVAG